MKNGSSVIILIYYQNYGFKLSITPCSLKQFGQLCSVYFLVSFSRWMCI